MKRIVIVGFGNLGQAILPLLKKEFTGWPIVIFERDCDAVRKRIADEMAITLHQATIAEQNYQALLGPWLTEGSFLLNLAVEVSSVALIALAQQHGVFYLDAGVEPWAYQNDDAPDMASNYDLREEALAFGRTRTGLPTAVLAQGANPGFVSTLVKCALEKMAHTCLANQGLDLIERNQWALLAEQLGVRVIQISECDTQVSHQRPAPGEFVNTWSVDGLITEAMQMAEAGWGSHETVLPPGARTHVAGCQAAILFGQSGANLKVRSWSPNRLEFEGFLITHNESISIADFLSLREGGQTRYRPTVYFAYHPCDETVAAMGMIADGSTDKVQSRRVVKDDVISGMDELGVFLISDRFPALWLGSNLSIGRTRAIAPYNNATSLQVVSSIVGAMLWVQQHPALGVIESEQLDHRHMYAFVSPYWGPMVCEQSNWRPTPDAANLQFAAFLPLSQGAFGTTHAA